MEAITSYAIMNIASTYLPHLDKIQNLTEEYLSGVKFAAVVSNDLDRWNQLNFSFPLMKRHIYSNASWHELIAAYIVDFYDIEWDGNLMVPLNRTCKTKYVFLIPKNISEVVTQDLEIIGLCNVDILTITTEDVQAQRLVEPCRGIGVKDLKKSTLNLHCKANISYMNFPPHVSLFENKLVGFEGLLVQTIIDNIGYDINYVDRHETEWGRFEPPSGLQGDVKTSSILGIGALYPFLSRGIFAEVVIGCEPTNLKWAAPIGAGPTKPDWFINLVAELSPTVWIFSFLMYLGLILISTIFDGKLTNLMSWAFHIMAMVLGVPRPQILQRALTLNIIFFGFMLTSHYQAMMSSKLTAPAKIPEITTLKQMSESGLLIQGPPVGGVILRELAAGLPEDPIVSDLTNRFEGIEDDVDDVLVNMIARRHNVYLRQAPILHYHTEKNPKTSGLIHLVEENLRTYMPLIIMTKHSCLANHFQKTMRYICDGGIGNKWMKDAMPKRSPPLSKAPRKLAMSHIEGLLFLLAVGWAIAILSFIYEMIYYYKKNIAARWAKLTRKLIRSESQLRFNKDKYIRETTA